MNFRSEPLKGAGWANTPRKLSKALEEALEALSGAFLSPYTPDTSLFHRLWEAEDVLTLETLNYELGEEER